MQAVCHCKTCQVNSGSAFSLNVAVPLDSLTVTGEGLRTYEDRSGASGQEQRWYEWRSVCARTKTEAP